MEKSATTMACSGARKLISVLIACAIQRCRLAESLCRLTVSLKCFRDRNPPYVLTSISDTGVGSSLMEFQELAYEKICPSADTWDGVLSVTTTGIHHKEINYYQLNLREAPTSRTRLIGLPPKQKSNQTFSGTEVRFSALEKESVDDFVAWIVCFLQKILVLKAPGVAIELLVEHIDSIGSRCEQLAQNLEDISSLISMSSIERLALGLENYIIKHGNAFHKDCHSCVSSREDLMVGRGLANSTVKSKCTGQTVEAVIAVAPVSSRSACWKGCCSSTQVLYSQDFSPCSVPQSSFDALKSINWQTYGLRVRESVVDGDGNVVFEWDSIPSFARIEIAVHIFHNRPTVFEAQRNPSGRNLVKKAIKMALDDLKANYAGLFLSSHAVKICGHAPELSRTIAGLILSSNDADFRGECIALLGLLPTCSAAEELVETNIREKIIRVIETNDTKAKGSRGVHAAPSLFECENLPDEGCSDQVDNNEEEGSCLEL